MGVSAPEPRVDDSGDPSRSPVPTLLTPPSPRLAEAPPGPGAQPPVWRPARREIWRRRLPLLAGSPVTNLVIRSVLTLGRRHLVEVRGLEHVAPENDPFLFTANHSQRLETLLLPSALIYHRRGKRVHFLADWPMMLVPFVGLLFRCGQVIPVTVKDAKPRFLNVLKPLFERPLSAFDQALARLRTGGAVGVFPEATMNRHPTRLLRGQTGAARLALAAGVPVVPAGIRFPDLEPGRPIPDRAPLVLEIGAPIPAPAVAAPAKRQEIVSFHHQIMSEIARLSGKAWSPGAQRRRLHVT